MKKKTIIFLNLFLAIFLFCAAATVFAEENESLKGVQSAKAIFDFRIGNPKSAAMHMDLIHKTYKDLTAMKKKPEFVVVFIGPSVKLVSTNRESFTPEDQKTIDGIAKTISIMSKDGIKFELCLVAAKVLKVEPASILPEIKRVGNGWISEIGYQVQGYSLVPAF